MDRSFLSFFSQCSLCLFYHHSVFRCHGVVLMWTPTAADVNNGTSSTTEYMAAERANGGVQMKLFKWLLLYNLWGHNVVTLCNQLQTHYEHCAADSTLHLLSETNRNPVIFFLPYLSFIAFLGCSRKNTAFSFLFWLHSSPVVVSSRTLGWHRGSNDSAASVKGKIDRPAWIIMSAPQKRKRRKICPLGDTNIISEGLGRELLNTDTGWSRLSCIQNSGQKIS